MKFETPKMDIFIFSTVIVTETSSHIPINRSATVVEANNTLIDETNQVEANNILTFTFGE